MAISTTASLEHQIRYVLRIRLTQPGADDLDWDTILDRESLQLAYELAGSLLALGKQLTITDGAARKLLQLHGIELNQQGGLRTDGGPRDRTTTRQDMIDLGLAYAFSDRQIALLRASARESCHRCPDICPLSLFCWDRSRPTGRRKKAKCGLGDHLIAVGLAGGSDAGLA